MPEIGRPSDFKPEFVEQALKLCKLGATDREVAEFFETDPRTLRRWKVAHADLAAAMAAGKTEADERVVASLYQRALGYNDGEKHIPADVVACIFWLKNRRPDEWRDVKAVDHSGTINHKHVSDLPDEALERIAAGSGAGAAEAAASSAKPRGVH